jgi:hypothetical protein
MILILALPGAGGPIELDFRAGLISDLAQGKGFYSDDNITAPRAGIGVCDAN